MAIERLLSGHSCQVCATEQLHEVAGFGNLTRITSDCRAFAAGGQLAVCLFCGAVQKIPDEKWLKEINQIYQDYQAYRIADGEEQLVMDPITGLPIKRSIVLMRELAALGCFSEIESAIDIGCGDGVTLKAMAEFFPNWALYGHELDASKEKLLEEVKGFKRLFTGDLASIDTTHHLVTMIHSLEHFVKPYETLTALRSKVVNGGYLFVEVCNIEENPFDILVADHLMHFSPSSLSNMALKAGFGAGTVHTDWVKKEISFLACSQAPSDMLCSVEPAKIYEKIQSYVAWLNAMQNSAVELAESTATFGIFGTSIAASWLAASLSDKVDFFVDEDPNRIGREYMGKPVYAPDHVPEGATVYLALAPLLSAKIAKRMQNTSWSTVEAPAI